MSALWSLSAADLASAIARREVSARDALEAHLERIDALEPRLNAFITLSPDPARAQADEVDRRLAAGERLGPLAGVPVACKDILCTEGIRTTAGSRILDTYRPPYDATVVARMRGADLPIVGKTNLDEFAMGSSNENSAYGPVRNPWDPDRVPGGSSGGSAAAVAAGMAPLGIGTDTGGSIREPAAFCGVVGVKPTYGLVSRYGLIAFASSLDQAGPFARTVRDAALLTEVIAGHDPRDSTSIPEPAPDCTSGLDGGVAGLRIGLVTELSRGEGFQPGVVAGVQNACEQLSGLGATIEETSLPSSEYALSAYYLIAPAECSSNLARYDGVRYGYRAAGDNVVAMNTLTREEGFGEEVKRRIMLGTYALSAGYYDAYYGRAQQVRTRIIREFEEAFATFDLLVSATSPTVAFRLGEKAADPLAMYLSDVCTVASNLAGGAAISIPCGLDETGLPVGFQLMGPPRSEPLLFRAASAVEGALGPLPAPPSRQEETAR